MKAHESCTESIQFLDYTGKAKAHGTSKNWLLLVAKILFLKFRGKKVIASKKSQNPEIEDLSIVFVTPKESRKLNLKFRGRGYPTDVLSFPVKEAKMGLGELVLCPEVLKRQAKEHDQSYKDELLLMLIHGFLHLVGYDHEKSLKEERRMMKIQEKIFHELKKEMKLCLSAQNPTKSKAKLKN